MIFRSHADLSTAKLCTLTYMKTNLLSFFLIMVIPTMTEAQGNISLLQFEATQIGQTVRVDFTLAMGNTCNDLKILRSADAIQFEEIGVIGGVCGSNSEIKSYTFTDSKPIANHINYYKLDLALLGVSDVITVRFINYEKHNVVVLQNTATKESVFYFQNTVRQPVSFLLFDSNGKNLHNKTFGPVSEIRFSVTDFPVGIYLFKIVIGDSDSYSGKIILH